MKKNKLWQKNWQLDKTVEIFETNDDLLLDQLLVKYDVWGSLAHAKGLLMIGILSELELGKIKKGLLEILDLDKQGKFNLENGDEDIHTKIENYLICHYGKVGKKVHTGRSRNDQVLTAIRLYSKDQLLQIWESVVDLVEVILKQASENKGVLMPGYTHMQKAMPSTVDLWFGAFAQGLLDDLDLLRSVYTLTNQSPLGSAAGYGVPLPLPKKYTASILGFEKVQTNSLYCQNSRGKFEAVILSVLIGILLGVNKFASDVLLFTTSEFGYLKVADELCTGSSLMPQKQNLDVAELLRSKVHILLGNYTQLVSLSSNLVSGYNRDLQDSKKPFFESLIAANDSLKVAKILVSGIKVDKEALSKSLKPEIFATHYALSLVENGVSFREAHKQIAKKFTEFKLKDIKSLAKGITHAGAMTNLETEKLSEYLSWEMDIFRSEKEKFTNAISNLLEEGGGK